MSMNRPETVAPPANEESNQDIWRLVEFLFAYKWVIFAFAVVGTGAAFFWTIKQPKIYAAQCTLEYIPNPPSALGQKIEGVSSPFSYWSDREYFATQNLIISSRAVAERVVEKLGLQYDEDFLGRASLPEVERAKLSPPTIAEAADRLRGSLSIVEERNTRLVHVHVEDRDPKRAALLANAVVDEYMTKDVEDRLGSTSAALEWLGRQLDGLKEQLETAEIALHDFKEKNHTLSISLEDRQNIVAADIQRYSEALTSTRTERIQLQARLAALRDANVDDPLQVHASVVDDSPTIRQLRESYAALLSERDELATSYGDAHPKMQAVNAKLTTLRTRLRAEVDGVIRRAEVDLNEIETVENGLRAALADANSDGMALNLREIEYRRLTRSRDNTAELYSAIMERTAETDLARALRVEYAQIVDRAVAPEYAFKPRLRINVPIGSGIGLLLGCVVAFVLSRIDRSVRTAEAVEAQGLTVLGLLPEISSGRAAAAANKLRRRRARVTSRERDLIVHLNPKSAVAECCRTVRTNLMFASADRQYRALVITSGSPREGKTTVSISLAISLAQSGKRVLLVDTDMRKPRVHRAFGLKSGPGVTSVLVGEAEFADAVQETEVPGLSILSSGPVPPNPSELLHTQQFRQLIEKCKESYDTVLFDSPPLAAVTDAAIIAPQVDGVLFVIHAQRTTRDALSQSLRQLRDVSAHLAGGILNDVDLSSRKYGYGSYYYYNREGYSSEA